MKPFIVANCEGNVCRCGFDLLITDTNDSLVLISLVDYPTPVKKAVADIRSSWSVEYGDYENPTWGGTFAPNVNIGATNNVFTKSQRCGDFNHAIMKNVHGLSSCIINWEDKPIVELLTDWLMNEHQMPVVPKLIEHLLMKDNTLLKECHVITCNPSFESLKAYQPDLFKIKQYLTDFSLYKNLQILTKVEDVNWEEMKSIEDYVLAFLDIITEKVRTKVKPLYSPNRIEKRMFEGKFMPYVGQVIPIQSAIEVLSQKHEKFVYLASEQGTGKTSMSINILNGYFDRVQKKTPVTFLLVPTTTVTQWEEEILNHFYTTDVNIYIIQSTSDFIKLHQRTNLEFGRPTFIICGKETFKLEYAKAPAVLSGRKQIEMRKTETESYGYGRTREVVKKVKQSMNVVICPDCSQPIKNVYRTSEDVYLTLSDFKDKDGKWNKTKANTKCSNPNCNASLWTATYNKTAKTSVIDYIRHKNIRFDLTILDECQENNNIQTIIGTATNTLLRHYSKKCICLSGTPNNGYASSLYNLLLAFMPRTLIANEINNIQDFVARYGTLEAVSKKDEDVQTYMRSGTARLKESDFREVEGVNPVAFVKFLSKNYIFMELKDLSKDLPPLTESYVPISPSIEQSSACSQLLNDLGEVNRFAAAFIEDSVVKHFLNNPYNWSPVKINGNCGPMHIQPENLEDEEMLLPKEAKALEIIKAEKALGRKCWIYTDFNEGGKYMRGKSLPQRLKAILEAANIKAYILPTGEPLKRKALIDKNTPKYDVFISNRKLVAVGLNLQAFSTFINYTPSYKVNDVEQANRRGWRANSTLENKIYHLYYSVKTEAKVMTRYQRKKAESNAIQGKFNIAIENESVRTLSAFGKTISNRMINYEEELPDISQFIKKEEIDEFKTVKENPIQVVIEYKVMEKADAPKKLQSRMLNGQLSLII